MEAKKYHIIQTDMQKEIMHGICVSNLACRVGRQLGLPEDTCHQLAVAGLVHDIGKLEIMKYIYSRDEGTPLHVEELRYVRTHPALGYVILNEEGYSPEIAQWILYHHENYDGSGSVQQIGGGNSSGSADPAGLRCLCGADDKPLVPRGV